MIQNTFAKFRALCIQYQEQSFAILRILFVLIVLYRTLGFFSTYSYLTTNAQMNLFIHCALLGFLLLGFLPRTTWLALFFLSKTFDQKYEAGTLGTDLVLLMSLFFFLSARGNNFLSLEKKFGLEDRFLPFLNKYKLNVSRAAIWCLFFYGVLTAYAVFYHLQDPYWVDGHTVRVMMVNSYLSSYSAFFRNLELDHPQFMSFFSKIAIYSQSFFQVFFIPLLLFRWGRVATFFWGMGFFLFSFFCLQLSYLPHLEIIFWLACYLAFIIDEPLSLRPKWEESPLFAYFIFLLVVNSTLFYQSRSMKNYRNLFALSAPNVFNFNDLKMANKFPVYYCVDQGKVLVQNISPEGKRLSLHRSDSIYFGNNAGWLRGQIYTDLDQFISDRGKGLILTKKLLAFVSKETGCKNFLVEIFENDQSSLSFDSVKYQNRLIKTLNLSF